MSELATDWAILQRGLHPAAKLVLWYLCDRHTPDFGCYPSQDQLAADAEISRASLNTQLRRLEDAGLIRRQRRPGQGPKEAVEIDPLHSRFRGRFPPKVRSGFRGTKRPKAISGFGPIACKAMSRF